MLVVLQSIFGFDLTTYLLPFITLLLTFSFAIAPLVGNIFLAFAFVFFMSPYDIGNKVQFGLFNLYTPPVIGYIKSVTLLYTIVTTTRNETVRLVLCVTCLYPWFRIVPGYPARRSP
jgi:small-conductance mechanosensitive channel